MMALTLSRSLQRFHLGRGSSSRGGRRRLSGISNAWHMIRALINSATSSLTTGSVCCSWVLIICASSFAWMGESEGGLADVTVRAGIYQ